MTELHVICRNRKNLKTLKVPEFESGFWGVSEADAARLIGGMVFLHETKAERSYFGGEVIAYRIIEPGSEHSGDVIFTLTAKTEGRGVAWRGAEHGMAWSGGLID